MASPELGLKITADASGLHEQLGRASNEVRTFGSAAQDTASQVEQQVNAQVRALGSSANYKRELRDCVKEVQNLTMAYRALSDEQRNGALGNAIQEQLTAAKARAAELKDAIADMNDEIKNMASDTAPFDAVNQGMGLIRDTMSAYIAISGLAGTSTAEFEQTVKDIAAVMTTFNAIIGVTNALQKQSALMTGIQAIKTWASEHAKRAETVAIQENTVAESVNSTATTANTAAKTANNVTTNAGKVATDAATAATVRLTVAQKAFNLVAKANPYILLGSIILTVGAGLMALFNASHKATEQMKKQKQAAEELAAAKQKLAEKNRTLAAAGSDLQVKFAALGAEYQTLKTKAEKQQWIEDNKSKFNELGFEINGVKMAEDVFVHNTSTVVAALLARAKALKMIDQAVEDMDDLKKKYADMDEKFTGGSVISDNGKNIRKYKGEDISDEEAKKAGVRTTAQRQKKTTYHDDEAGRDVTYTESDKYTKEEIARIEANRKKEAIAVQRAVKKRYEAEVQAIYDNVGNAVKAQIEADKKLYSLTAKPGSSKTTKGGGKSKEEEKAEKGSLADLKKQREELAKIQEKGTYKKHKTNADEVAKEIRRLDQEIADAQFVIDFNANPAKVSLNTIEDQYNRLYAKVRSQKLSPEDKEHANKNLQTINQAGVNKKYAAGLDIKPAENELISLQKKADEIFAQMQNPEVHGSDMFKTLKESYDAAVEDINKKKIEMGIDTSVAEGSIDDLQSKIVALLGERNALVLDVQTEDSKSRILAIDEEVQKLSKDLSGDASELKISTESAHASIGAMEARITALKQQLNLDVSLSIEGQKDIVQEILQIEKDIKQHKITIGLETDPTPEQLKKLAQQAQEAMQPKKKSSFEEAVGTPKPAKNDYEGQLRQIQSMMDANDTMLSKLEEIKAKYEEMGQTGEESYQKILDKMTEMKAANEELADQAKTVDKQDKKAKKRAKNWEHATDAVGSFGDALSSIGDATNSPELNVAGVIAQTLGNLALGASEAIAQASSLGPWGWIAFGVLAMAQLASMCAQVSSLTGGYATGGIIPGNSISGDKLTAKVNSGEMILNSNLQYRLWNLANGGSVGETSSTGSAEVEFVLHGDTLRGVLKNTNRGLKRKGRKTDI